MKVWFITGCSTGIGKALTEKILAAGHAVVATARKQEAVAHFQIQYPETALSLALDVNNDAQIENAVKETLMRFGKIDVLINNAGYGLEGAIEELSMSQIRCQMDANFFGLVAVTQAVLPTMRAQGSGFIANIASVAGLRGFAGMGVYNASKFAVVGLTEALAQEVKPFGIKVCAVEPGPYRTDWAGRSLIKSEAIHSETSPYRELNVKIESMLESANGNQPGDPTQIADVLLSAAEAADIPVHFLFGDEAIRAWEDKMTKLRDENYMRYFPHTKRSL